jgi:hypothetical protein
VSLKTIIIEVVQVNKIMNTISLKTKVDADGKLSLQLPPELANQELDLVIVYQSTLQPNEELRSTVDSFYGCLSDDPILVEEENQKEIA